MLSGGEPTLHPELPRLIAELVARPIVRILVNSNGVRIARSDALPDLLTEHRNRVEVYLQFDGLRAETTRHHRGADIQALKQEAVRRLSHRQIFTTLVMHSPTCGGPSVTGSPQMRHLGGDPGGMCEARERYLDREWCHLTKIAT